MQNAGEDQHHDQHDCHFDAAHGGADHAALQRADPVHVLLFIEEIGEADHHQEGAAEGGDGDMCPFHDVGIGIGLEDRDVECGERAHLRGDRHDRQREEDAHAEDGDDDAPGQEALLPDRRHVLQLAGIDNGIVEGKRDFKHAEHRADEERGGGTAHRPRGLPADEGAECKSDGGEGEGPMEIGENASLFLGHAGTSAGGMSRRCRHHESAV